MTNDPIVKRFDDAALALAVSIKHDVNDGAIRLAPHTQARLDEYLAAEQALNDACEEIMLRNRQEREQAL